MNPKNHFARRISFSSGGGELYQLGQSNMSQPVTKELPPRLTSLDAFRGFVMFLMMGEVFHFCRVAGALPESGF